MRQLQPVHPRSTRGAAIHLILVKIAANSALLNRVKDLCLVSKRVRVNISRKSNLATIDLESVVLGVAKCLSRNAHRLIEMTLREDRELVFLKPGYLP